MNDAVALATAAIARLDQLAGPDGAWSDFWVAAGPSTSWVTAYAAHALATAARSARLPAGVRGTAAGRADAAAATLVLEGRAGEWGWSPSTRSDADSTAWAARALMAAGQPVEDRTWAFLAGHATERGYRTYRSRRHTGRWAEPTPEVSAVVLLAQHEGGRLARGELADAWRRWCTGTDGSHWWVDPWHPRALVAAAAAAAGTRVEAPTHPGAPPATTAGLAARFWVEALSRRLDPRLSSALLDSRLPEGGWPGDAGLRVPPQHGDAAAFVTVDARGVHTTATVLHAAMACLETGERAEPVATPTAHRRPSDPSRPTRPAPAEQGRDTRWDHVIAAAARSQGVDADRACTAVRELTCESLAARSPWPTPALSVLAAGSPLEFSASERPALRLTAEVGDPRLPPSARLRSGLAAVTRTVQSLGLEDGWAAARGVVAVLASPDLPVPSSNRFWLWAGLDLPPFGPAMLKAYLSLHPGVVGGWPERRAAALRAAGVPKTGTVWGALDLMRSGGGWGHEVGIGVGPGGRWALKLYDELDRWRPDVVASLLDRLGLPGTVDDLLPEIPGVIRARTGVRRRSGIAIRVDPESGDVVDLTTAVAFPVPLVGRRELTERVFAWLCSLGQPVAPLDALVAAVEPDWVDAPPAAKMLSLVTRTVGRTRMSTTVYVRPAPPR